MKQVIIILASWVIVYFLLIGISGPVFSSIEIGLYPFRPEIFWNFFAGFGTIITIITTYVLYLSNQKSKENAQINAIISEIRHNLAISRTFSYEPNDIEVQKIINELKLLKEYSKYPNLDDRKKDTFNHELFKASGGFKSFEISTRYQYIFYFKNEAIEQALSTGKALVLSKRIFLNLGHLDYSIQRVNLVIQRWNSREDRLAEASLILFQRMQKEYFIWLHFRLQFTLIDILRTYPERKIWDKDLLNIYKNLAGPFW